MQEERQQVFRLSRELQIEQLLHYVAKGGALWDAPLGVESGDEIVVHVMPGVTGDSGGVHEGEVLQGLLGLLEEGVGEGILLHLELRGLELEERLGLC